MILDKIFKKENGEYISVEDVLYGISDVNNFIYAMAEARAINLIAKTIAKTELQVFAKNNKVIKDSKNDIYWLLNLQPNKNENGTMFLYKLAIKLLIDKSVLIVINKTKKNRKMLFIADSYNCTNDILYGKKFDNIVISDLEGNSITLNKTYSCDEVIYLSIPNSHFDKSKISFSKSTEELLKSVVQKYKISNIPKWQLKKPGNQPTLIDVETGKPISYKEYAEKITDGLFSNEAAIILLSEAFELVNLNKDNKESIDDYKELFKQISDSIANMYDIPLDVFYGNKTEKSNSNNDFITYAVDFYYSTIEDGFNISFVGEKDYIDGEYIRFNRFSIFHKDILDAATGIDKLMSNTFSRNEVNRFLNLPHIDEKWADEHNLTKNYANVKGGEKEYE